MDFYQWVEEVRRHTLTEEYGPEEAERLMAVSRTLVAPPPEARHPGSSATVIDSDWQRWDHRDDSTLLRPPSADGIGHRPKSEEAGARDLGLSVEQWRRLAR